MIASLVIGCINVMPCLSIQGMNFKKICTSKNLFFDRLIVVYQPNFMMGCYYLNDFSI